MVNLCPLVDKFVKIPLKTEILYTFECFLGVQ